MNILEQLTDGARRLRERNLQIHTANIRGARTRRQAFARYHAYMRRAPDAMYRESLGSELMSQLHRIDARGGAA